MRSELIGKANVYNILAAVATAVAKARMELGLTYKRLNDPDNAIAAYETVEAGWTQWPTVQVELAELELQWLDIQAEIEKIREELG